jgi:hypothetical protein
MRRVLIASLATALAMASPVSAQSPPPSPDPELAAGVRQVEEGDYNVAVITLDRAAQALARQPGRSRELAQAYLYLGIAYVGRGSETAAKAKFREALGQVRDLALAPEQYPPKVVELFEKARDETRQGAPVPAAPATAANPARKKRGSRLPLVLIGVGAAGAAGAALALGGGGETAGGPPSTETLNGSVSCGTDTVSHRFTPRRAGSLDALLTWTDRSRTLQMYLGLAASVGESGIVARSMPASNTTARLTAPVENRSYWIFVEQAGGGPCLTYTLALTYPQ